MTIDIKDFYLMMPMDRYKYMQLKLADLPKDVIQKYIFWDKVTKEGHVYMETRQGMYRLP